MIFYSIIITVAILAQALSQALSVLVVLWQPMDASMQMCTDTDTNTADLTISCYCSMCARDVPMQEEADWICLTFKNSRIGRDLHLYVRGEWQILNHKGMKSLGGKSKLWFCPRCSRCILRDAAREHRYEPDVPYDSLLLEELEVAISTSQKHWKAWDCQRNWNYATSTPKKLRLIWKDQDSFKTGSS